MKLELVLEQLNSFEKNSFLKIIMDIVNRSPKNITAIEKILSSSNNKSLRDVDSLNISKVFSYIQEEFQEYIQQEYLDFTSQLDIITDIIIRDGNCIMKQDWFSNLYGKEIKFFEEKIKTFKTELESENSELPEERIRDYKIFKACLETAYTNDDASNSQRKITKDEQTILTTLASMLELSQKEIKLINYLVVPLKKKPVESIVEKLKNIGVLFYSKKHNTIYIADEVVRILRKVRGKEVADKYFRRVLRLLSEPQINMICRKHNIEWRKKGLNEKIKDIIEEGISLSSVLTTGAFKPGTKVSQKKKFLNDIAEKGLKITPRLKGSTLDEKIKSLIKHFEEVEFDEKVGISIEGYERLLIDLEETIHNVNRQIKLEFELQEDHVLESSLLLDYNIKPKDILEILPPDSLKEFCVKKGISSRGDIVNNILDAYKDSEDIYLENYENFAMRDLNALKDNGIKIKESNIGVKFEELTKLIFSKLGLNVDENLRKKINTRKDKIDVIINLGNNNLILVECKSAKDRGYNKFSTVSRQLKAYQVLAKKNNYNVVKSLLVAPEFSDDFIRDCELEYELNLSLITSSSLYKILKSFKKSDHNQFPYKLLMRDVLIQADRVIKALEH